MDNSDFIWSKMQRNVLPTYGIRCVHVLEEKTSMVFQMYGTIKDLTSVYGCKFSSAVTVGHCSRITETKQGQGNTVRLNRLWREGYVNTLNSGI